jgi:hypothetical protein
MRNLLSFFCLMTLLAGAAVAQEITMSSNGAVSAAGSTSNEPKGFGVGVILGEPTGFSAKAWLSDTTAIDAGAAWSFSSHDAFQLHGDFLWHNFDLFQVGHTDLPLYFGLGARAKFEEHHDTRVGIRAPVGLAYLFPNTSLEIFGEVAPILDFTPSTSIEFNAGFGIRYYFR